MLLYLVGILILSFLLVWSTNLLLFNFKLICKKLALSSYIVSELVVSLITTLPELTVGVIAAASGYQMLALGNVIGSNIVNASLIIGMAAIIGGVLNIKDNSFGDDFSYAFLAGTLPMVLLSNKTLSRLDGLILIGFWFFYQFMIFHRWKKRAANTVRRLLADRKFFREIILIIFGAGIMLFSADRLVNFAEKIAKGIGIPDLVVGILLVSVGTSLPELIFQTEAIQKKEAEMALGNLMGSIIANGTLILGIVCLISPIKVDFLPEYLMAIIVFMAVFTTFYIFASSRKRLDRWEGIILVIMFLGFAVFELIVR